MSDEIEWSSWCSGSDLQSAKDGQPTTEQIEVQKKRRVEETAAESSDKQSRDSTEIIV